MPDSKKRPINQISNLEPSSESAAVPEEYNDKFAKIDDMLANFKKKTQERRSAHRSDSWKPSPQKPRATFANMFGEKKESSPTSSRKSKSSDGGGFVMKCYEPAAASKKIGDSSRTVAAEPQGTTVLEEDGLQITEYGVASAKPAAPEVQKQSDSEEDDGAPKMKSFMMTEYVPKSGHRLDAVKITEYTSREIKVYEKKSKCSLAQEKSKKTTRPTTTSEQSSKKQSGKASPSEKDYGITSNKDLINKQSEFIK